MRCLIGANTHTAAKADQVLIWLSDQGKGEYTKWQCPVCDGWHVTRQPSN